MLLRIPDCVGIMPNLKQFVIDGNNIENIRDDIIRCGTSRILKHIRQNTNSTNSSTKEYVIPVTNLNIYPDK